ncbi:hypothetical protein FRC03_008625 [Tulasnella sp. 419]|nr:hypothetical protein FRC03_008625 [Tulasnella sp. 419]
MAISGQVLTISLVVVSITTFIFVKRILRIGQREPLLPPGPPTKPILGNLTILPIKDSYAKFTEWAKQYGGIYSLKVSSNTIIVVSSFDAVYNVMEKNGLKTANRPVRSHSIRIFGDQGSLAVVQYGPSLRTWRRAASEMLSPTACDRHMPILMSEINQLMNDLLDHPETFMKDIERAILSSAFSTIFGIRTPSIESWEAQTFLRATNEFFRLSAPGEVPPVDLFPILNYIPDRYVRNWRARCDAVRQDQEALWFSLVDKAQERLNRGSTNGCLSETLINRAEEWDLDRRIIA